MELWTGKQLFNVLLRSHAKMRIYVNLTVAEKSYSKSRETMCPKDGFVCIRNSELISGQLGKATVGQYPSYALAICLNDSFYISLIVIVLLYLSFGELNRFMWNGLYNFVLCSLCA